MKVSLRWLRELVELPGDPDAATVAAALTRQGLEVEGMEARGREVAGVVVAEVVAVRPHPGAEKLRLVRVRAGAASQHQEVEVVCGAPNVPPPGNRVAWAAPGARLPGGQVIAPREIRGVLSPGMLCSEPELGIGPKGDGILILSPSDAPGADVAALLGVADDVFEVNVTPNRSDALSHLGIARELAAALGGQVRRAAVDEGPPPPANGPTADVKIADPEACPRYLARLVAGLTVGPSPLAIRLRLEACGMRAISNLVDVTNYVLLETGQPLHAFDFAKLDGGIVVRRATDGEKLVTLDGQERALVAGDIVIADRRGPVALAGVMGGAATEVSDATRDVLLEAATFDPRSVRRTAKRLGLHSEASYRFERGVDANGVAYAAARAAALLAQLGGGRVVPAPVDVYPRPQAPRPVTLTMQRLARVSGSTAHTPQAVAERLGRIGLDCRAEPDRVVAQIPTFRPDLAIEEDLVEEVLRLGGDYQRPPEIERVLTNARSLPDPEGPADRARDLLAAAGLHESVTWAFVPRGLVTIAGDDPAVVRPLAVKNPISADYEVMRTWLVPGLAQAARRNLARGVADVRLFEVSHVVRKAPPDAAAGTLPDEPLHAAGVLAGRAPGWLKPGEPLDFFDAKHVVEELLAGFGVTEATFEPGASAAGVAFLHPGVSATVRLPASAGGRVLGAVGELDPRVARALELDGVRVLAFELDLGGLAVRPPRTSPPPRFPAVTRDVSFWIDEAVTSAQQRAAFLAADQPLLREVAVREDFRDARYAPAGKKGMLWTMTYRADDRTLTDAEVDASHSRVVSALSGQYPIQIR